MVVIHLLLPLVSITHTNRGDYVGERPFDVGTGASIYCTTIEGTGMATGNWKYLGILTNDKPSAVFKLGGGAAMMTAAATSIVPGSRLEIGISIEPLAALEQLYVNNASKAIVPAGTAASSSGSTIPNPVQIAQRIGESIFNYLMSFARPLEAMAAQMDATMVGADIKPSTEVVPVQRLQEWFNNLIKKATNDPEGFRRQYMV